MQHLDSVFVDAKVQQFRKNSGKTVTIITKEALQNQVGKSVAQVINEVSGFEINGSNSNNGQNLGYFVRGGKNRQVLIVIDGVPVNDGSQIANDYDLRLMATGQIERIEILKGASSVLYGSGAGAAVISITTLKMDEQGFRLNATSLFGTDRSAEDEDYKLESLENNLNIGGKFGHFHYEALVNHRYSNGLSAVAAPENSAAFEPDDFNAFNSRFNFGYHLNNRWLLDAFLSVDRVINGFDDFSYYDAAYESSSKQFRAGNNFQYKYSKGSIVLNDSYTQIKREITSSYPAKYDAEALAFDAYWQHGFNNRLKTVVGLNGSFNSMNSYAIPYGEESFERVVDDAMAKFDNYDPYINVVYQSSFGLSLNAGIRMNMHSVYGEHFVYQVNPSYYFDFNHIGLKFMGSYSTAYITPSLYQIYDPIYGNEELNPEENTTIETGLELTHEKGIRFSAIYFHRSEEQFIDFVTVNPDLFIYQYQNIADSFEVSGLELETFIPFGKQFNLNANYTYTNRDDRFSLRIPKHKGNASLSYIPSKTTNFGIQFQYVSERDDNYFNPETFMSETVVLDAYSLLHFSAQHELSRHLTLLLRLSNILNTEYEELYRYQTKGRSVQIGLKLQI